MSGGKGEEKGMPEAVQKGPRAYNGWAVGEPHSGAPITPHRQALVANSVAS